MLHYDLDRLGWFEFEQLIQTLLKIRLGCGVEAWGGRGDWGRDAYFDGTLCYPTVRKTRAAFLFQCKFVEAANAAGAKPEALILGAVRKECDHIVKRQQQGTWKKYPTVYALFSNASVAPCTREKVTEALNSVLPKARIAVHDGHDVCQWLNGSPEVVRSFPQLLSLRDLNEWLRECVHSDVLSRSESAIALAESQAKIFVPTAAYFDARTKLHKHHFVVLEGPPEMGKTTIGRVIALSQLSGDWEAIECRGPADVLKMYRRDSAQVFVADDFFGRTEYHPERVSKWQDDLPLILPKLNATHWLILTSRAHLLEMGKARLDIAGENSRFPHLGEVIVNAGRLTRTEKARILYRHSKAAELDPVGKAIIKRYALQIVLDTHFTPERIRRLVSEIIPSLSVKSPTEDELPEVISEALADPTREMRISFRALPLCHRWLLFALLEADESARSESSCELRERYEALCPPEHQRPYQGVLGELTEAFVKHTVAPVAGEQVDWIHPSCRDLAIDELTESPQDRARFLHHCSEVGVELASSLAGGPEGDRQLPLLQTENDWGALEGHCSELAQSGISLISILSQNLRLLDSVEANEPRLQAAAVRLRRVLSSAVLPAVVAQLNYASYHQDFDSLKAFFKTCAAVGLKLEINFTHHWDEIELDVREWCASPYEFWELPTNVPEQVLHFLDLVQEHQPAFLQSDRVCESLPALLTDIIFRAGHDLNRSEEDVEEEEYTARANACTKCAETYSTLAKFDRTRILTNFGGLTTIGYSFKRAAEALEQQAPLEKEEDGAEYSPNESADVDVSDLFRDL